MSEITLLSFRKTVKKGERGSRCSNSDWGDSFYVYNYSKRATQNNGHMCLLAVAKPQEAQSHERQGRPGDRGASHTPPAPYLPIELLTLSPFFFLFFLPLPLGCGESAGTSLLS